MFTLLVSAVPLYKATNSALDVPPSPFPVAVLPPPTVLSLSPCLCSPRGRDHGHASHHGTERGTGGGIGPHGEPRAVLQDPGKHPTGDARSCVCVAASLSSADAPGPGSEPAAGPRAGLWSRTGPPCRRCATRCGSKGGLGIEGTGETQRRKSVVSVGKLITGGRGSRLKEGDECKWSSRLSAPEIFGIGLQWEKVGLCWERNHHFHPISDSAFCGDGNNLPDISWTGARHRELWPTLQTAWSEGSLCGCKLIPLVSVGCSGWRLMMIIEMSTLAI